MNKKPFFISRFLVCLIFFAVPLAFAYLPDVLGFSLSSHPTFTFESIKILLFEIVTLILLISWGIENFIFHYQSGKWLLPDKKTTFAILGILAIITLSSVLSSFPGRVLWGSEEKHFGLVAWLTLGTFFLIVQSLLKENRSTSCGTCFSISSGTGDPETSSGGRSNLMASIKYSLLGGFILIAFYAAIQALSLDPLHALYKTRVPLNRVFSTLGNANYLAGYCLMLLPLFFPIYSPVKGRQEGFVKKNNPLLFPLVRGIISNKIWFNWIIIILIFFVLLLTKSIFGIILGSLYLIYKSFGFWKNPMRRYTELVSASPQVKLGDLRGAILLRAETSSGGRTGYMTTSRMVTVVLLLISIAFSTLIFINLPGQRFGSMMARPYIWKSTIEATFSGPKTALIGYGPDTLDLVFEHFRDPHLSIYEDPAFTADRAHNVFFDILFWSGLLGLGTFIFLLKKLWQKATLEGKELLFLFLLFFSFNIPVISHWILLGLIFQNNIKQ